MKLTYFTITSAFLATSQGAIIAYWDQNSNDLPGGGFGFEPTSFPQAADQGVGSLTLEGFDPTLNASGAYSTISSFAGTLENAQPGVLSGGSLSPIGGPDTINNGMAIVFEISTFNYQDIVVSWAQRGTASGFNSRQFDYSLDGVDWVPIGTDTGALGSTFLTQTYDLSGDTTFDGKDTLFFRIVLDGATGSTGNNRFDNITFAGTQVIPEPSAALLSALGLIGLFRRHRLTRR